MGSLRLKKKDDYLYRRAKKGEGRCEECLLSVKMYVFPVGIGGAQYRCHLFGLGSSVRYRIHPGHTCKAHIRKSKGGNDERTC